MKIASRKGGNGGYWRKTKGQNLPPKRQKLKQNIGRKGAIKAPKS